MIQMRPFRNSAIAAIPYHGECLSRIVLIRSGNDYRIADLRRMPPGAAIVTATRDKLRLIIITFNDTAFATAFRPSDLHCVKDHVGTPSPETHS